MDEVERIGVGSVFDRFNVDLLCAYVDSIQNIGLIMSWLIH